MAGKASRQRKAASAENLVLVGSEQARLCAPSSRNWTKAKEREFLTVLAETCNVTRAAAEAGVSLSYAYKRRKSNAGFRAGWAEAIGTAYQRLELVLLDRAFNGTEKIVRRKDGSEERMVEYSNQTALALLKIHRDTAVEANTELPPDSVDKIRDRLISKLERLKKRRQTADASE